MNKPILEKIRLSGIIFDEGIYPRVDGHDPARVQEYAKNIDAIESAQKFISVNADSKLVDGRHRMLAYKKNADGDESIEITVFKYPISSPLESFSLAVELQDMGKSLEREDRISGAKKLYSFGLMDQKTIAKRLNVSPGRVSQWLSRTIKDEKAEQKKKVRALWMSCHTQQVIADSTEVKRITVKTWIDGFVNSLTAKELTKSTHSEESYKIPIYNIWKQQKKSNKVSHFGNSEPMLVDNLLYLYTKPFDVVVDPFAGSGSTIDVCANRFRRHFVSDRKPIVERENEIRKFDVTDGLPPLPRWKDVKLVYLDPPYWKQAEGQYSEDDADLANMDLDRFNINLSGLIKGFGKKLKGGDPSYIALIIQPTQWKAEGRETVDHIADMIKLVKLPLDARYSAPYETQQYTPQMVNWAKENRKCLVLTREIIVWKVA